MARDLSVLLADDVRLHLDVQKTFFQRRGFKVLTAPDGPTALALAELDLPSCIVLDEFMPGLRGTEVCARLKSNDVTRRIPVVIASIEDGQELRELSLAAGATAFVPKAGGEYRLLRVVANVLGIPMRKSARITVVFSVDREERGDFRETLGRAVDLSEGGLCLEVNRAYDVGSELRLRFVLSGERREIRADARVRWTKEQNGILFLMGVEFTRLSEYDQDRLNAHIDRVLAS